MKIIKQPNNNQHGFGVLLIVLAVLVLAGIGIVGYSTYKARQKPVEVASHGITAEPPIQPEIKKPVDPTAGWKKYVSKTGKYSLKHPTKWHEDVCDESATDLVLYLGTNKHSRVICNSEHVSQVIIVSTPAAPTESEQELGANYSNKTSKKVKVDGVAGERTSGKLKTAEFGAPTGTLIVRYFFLAPHRSYIASYVQTPTGDYKADNLKEFDLIIRKTLRFTM